MGKVKDEFLNHPLRIAAIQFSQRSEDTMKVPEIIADGGFNVEQLLHVVGNGGYGLYRKEKHYDILKQYIADSKKRGIGIILYANSHMVEPGQYKLHPDWVQVGPDNNAADVYSTYLYACVNSPWREQFFQRIREALEQDIRGIFLDGPIFIAPGCHCKYCRKLFLEEFGHSMDDATQGEICSFKSEHIARFVKDVRNVIRESGKDVALYCNCLGLVENVTGCTVDAVFPYIDLVGSEGGFLFYGNPNEVSLWHGSETAKFLESKAQGKPYVIFSAGNDQPWAREMHTVPETKLLYASAISNGANVWYGIHGLIDNFRTPAGETAFYFNRFLAKNEKYFVKTRRRADTALLWSQRTADLFPEDVAQTDFTKAEKSSKSQFDGSFRKEFRGSAELLFRMHSQFAIIDETCVKNGDLSEFKLLILPNTCCIDDKTAAEIRRFVENGGSVIATLESGRFDGDGNRMAHPPLWDLFGICSAEEVREREPGCTYIKFENGPLAGIAGGEPVAGFVGCTLRCNFTSDAKTLASSFIPLAGRYAKFPTETYPSVIARRVGKGTVIYLAGGLGQTFFNFGVPEMKAAAEALVKAIAPGELRVENAFPSVEVELRGKPGKLVRLIHFANHTGYMRRPVDRFIPNPGIRVALKTEAPAKRVFSLFHPKEIPFEYKDGEVRFTVDLEDYELVAVEL